MVKEGTRKAGDDNKVARRPHPHATTRGDRRTRGETQQPGKQMGLK